MAQLVDNTKLVKAFNFQSVGGAYFKGDKDNLVMVRLNGFGFENDKVMQDYLEIIEEQKQRDHRRINKILELFTFNQLAGPGMPIWLPNGQIVRQLIGDYVHSVQKKFGFMAVNTPILGNVDLYKNQDITITMLKICSWVSFTWWGQDDVKTNDMSTSLFSLP